MSSSNLLSRLNIPESTLNKLLKNKIKSCADVLSIYTPFELAEKLNLDSEELKLLLDAVSRVLCPMHNTVDGLCSDGTSNYFATGIPLLDKALRGGIQKFSLCEMSGPADTGKTQFCTWLTLQAVLPAEYGGNAGSSVLYIDSENGFLSGRLYEMASLRCPTLTDDAFKALLNKIHVYKISRLAELDTLISDNLEQLIIHHNPNLIVIDSISLFYFSSKPGHSAGGTLDRFDALQKKAGILKQTAESFGLPVVVTNDVSNLTEKGTLTPANVWGHAVNTRILLENMYTEPSHDKVRKLTISKSPLAPPSVVYYVITSRGIETPS